MTDHELPEQDPRRRTMPAGHVLLGIFIAFAVAALLNAQGMHKTALSQSPGFGRDVAATLTAGLAEVSGLLQIDEPRHLFKAALGRGDDDVISTKVVFAPTVNTAPNKPAQPVKPAKPNQPAKPAKPVKPTFSPQNKLRLYLTGDSLITDPATIVLDRLADNPAVKPVANADPHAATGLIQPAVFNWFTYLPKQIAELNPDLTVFTIGANDGQGFTGVTGGEEFGSPAWKTEYRRRVAGVMGELMAKGGRVVWLGLPITRDPDLAKRWALMNEIQKSEAAKYPGKVVYVNLFDRFKDAKGNYADYLPDASGQQQLVRAPDGIHYSAAGAGIVATAILKAIDELVTLSATNPPPAVPTKPKTTTTTTSP
ncbi:MAG: DUF459 domain-containing protein [Actinomycetota bacterium]